MTVQQDGPAGRPAGPSGARSRRAPARNRQAPGGWGNPSLEHRGRMTVHADDAAREGRHGHDRRVRAHCATTNTIVTAGASRVAPTGPASTPGGPVPSAYAPRTIPVPGGCP